MGGLVIRYYFFQFKTGLETDMRFYTVPILKIKEQSHPQQRKVQTV